MNGEPAVLPFGRLLVVDWKLLSKLTGLRTEKEISMHKEVFPSFCLYFRRGEEKCQCVENL
jgi:hypothetical protein